MSKITWCYKIPLHCMYFPVYLLKMTSLHKTKGPMFFEETYSNHYVNPEGIFQGINRRAM